MGTQHREVRVAPNIWRTPYGFRVYGRRRDPQTGTSAKTSKRFAWAQLPCSCPVPQDACQRCALELLEHYRDTFKLESKRLRREARRRDAADAADRAGTVEADAATYLTLAVVKAMPSYADRARDIRAWVAVLRDAQARSLPRRTVTTRRIDEHLQAWINDGYAASTVNGRRTALMALWTTLDGRGAANPVREARVYAEPELQPRGIPYDLVQAILEELPAAIRYTDRPDATIRELKTKPRIELEACTGMRPSQIGRLEPGQHFSIAERWYVIPRSKKGQQRKQPRHPRPATRKHMTDSQAAVFQRFHDLNCYGPYSASSRRRQFKAAVAAAEQRIRKARRNPAFRFPPDLKPYDLRHSFATEVYRQTKDLETVAELLDHSTTRMTKRYALGAVSDVLKAAARQFERGTRRKRKPPSVVRTAKKPPGRAKGGTGSQGPGST